MQIHAWLLEHVPAEIGVFDPEGRFLYTTPLGIRDPVIRAWVVGRKQQDYCRRRGWPDGVATNRQAVIDRVVAEGRSISFEEILNDAEGRQHCYLRTVSPVLEGNRVTHVICYGQEISDLRSAEDGLRRAHAELEEEMEARRRVEDDLRRALGELEALRDRLQAENVSLREEIRTGQGDTEILGRSAGIEALRRAIATVAPTEAHVLIEGETGTGKELVARAIHEASGRSDQPLIRVNCAAVPETLFESEFFGHVKGAFTGAAADRAGRFELADKGTLFLDEVGEIPPAMQSKLLRVLQEGEFERLGSTRTRSVNVRIIAATNRDLQQEVRAGRFREDLYYRLSVFPIVVPPLRERRDDIPLLVRHCLERGARKLGRPTPYLSEEALTRLAAYDWPGNVRELENLVERTLITARGGAVRFALPLPDQGPGFSAVRTPPQSDAILPEAELRQRERENLLAALRQCEWRIHGPRGAAQLLGIKPTTLASRIRKLGLSRLS